MPESMEYKNITKRWSARRKKEVVLRLFRGEPIACIPVRQIIMLWKTIFCPGSKITAIPLYKLHHLAIFAWPNF